MKYRRMSIEVESPEELGYSDITCNLAESSVRDMNYSFPKGKMLLQYGSHKGNDTLRELIINGYRQKNIHHVLVTPGAAAALFIIHTALLKPKDEIIVMHPNYSTNLETPAAIGCKIITHSLNYDEDYNPDEKSLFKKITAKTKLVSLTNPNNPTGKVFNPETLQKIISYCNKKNIPVLIDETYSTIPFPGYSHHILPTSDNLIRVGSLSKAFGAPGIRIGWIHCSNSKWMYLFLAAKEQIIICNSVVDEFIATDLLLHQEKHLSHISNHIETNFSVVKKWIEHHPLLEAVMPEAGVVMMPRFKSKINTAEFYKLLFTKYSTYTGPGHWFGLDDSFFRLGFGWPTTSELRKGLKSIDTAADEILK